MKKRKNRKTIQRRDNTTALVLSADWDDLTTSGYTSLDKSPEVMTACRKIAELIGSITIHLMTNSDKGDVRIVNGLSRAIDISPTPTMVRKNWMEAIVMNLLLHGNGNSIVLPHTAGGRLESLEPIAASRVGFIPVGKSDYQVMIDGVPFKPEQVLHFVHNPNKDTPWMGDGLTVYVKDVANTLKQARATEKGYLESKWRPSLIVKVDAMDENFSGPAGRTKLRQEYIDTSEAGEPWIIPMGEFDVQEVKPMTLQDLAISDTIDLDRRSIASILGVPPFVLGVGEYDKDAWNNFIQNTIRPIAIGIQQEMTKKLITSPDMYLRFNVLSLMDWDLNTVYTVFGGLSDRGIVSPNEVRDRIGMNPIDGLDEIRILENYIPADRIGDQAKLKEETT